MTSAQEADVIGGRLAAGGNAAGAVAVRLFSPVLAAIEASRLLAEEQRAQGRSIAEVGGLLAEAERNVYEAAAVLLPLVADDLGALQWVARSLRGLAAIRGGRPGLALVS